MDNESLMLKLVNIQNYHNLNLFDALVFYCEDNDVDYEVILPLLDKSSISEIKNIAVKNRMFYAKPDKVNKDLKYFCDQNTLNYDDLEPLLKKYKLNEIMDMYVKPKPTGKRSLFDE